MSIPIDPKSKRVAVALFADGRREIMNGTDNPFEIDLGYLQKRGLEALAIYSFGILIATLYGPVSEEDSL